MSNTTEFVEDEAEQTLSTQIESDAESSPSAFTWTADRSVSEQVVQAVADVSGSSITEIEPLNNAVDADALNKLFSTKLNGNVRRGGYLSFEYADYFVTVFANGQIKVANGQ